MPDPRDQLPDYEPQVIDQELSEYVADCLLTPNDTPGVKEHFSRVPYDLARWNRLYAQALREVGYAKIECKSVEGARFAFFKDKLTKIKGKTTEKDVNACVYCDVDWQAAQRALVDAEANAQDLRGICDGIRAKGFALNGLGYLARGEMNVENTIKNE